MLRWIAMLAAGLAIALVACEKRELDHVTPKSSGAETSAVSAQLVQQQKNEYIANAQKEIDNTKVEIDRLLAKMQGANAKSKAKLGDEIRMLKEKSNIAEQRLSHVRSATTQTWSSVQADLDKALADLRRSSTRARKERG